MSNEAQNLKQITAQCEALLGALRSACIALAYAATSKCPEVQKDYDNASKAISQHTKWKDKSK